MAGLDAFIESAKRLLGADGQRDVEHIGDHRVEYDERTNSYYCLRCYKEGDTQRDFVEEDCDAPEEEHDPVPYYPQDDQRGGLDGLLGEGGQRRRRNREPDGYICTKCEKWSDTIEDLKERECDAY